MIFSYNWLQSFFKQRLPAPGKLAEFLARHFAKVEEVKKQGKDFVLDIDVRPNRAGDCFSHLGIAREIAVITNSKLKTQNSKLIEDKNLKARDFISIEVKDREACPRYTAGVVTEVKVGPSPKYIKERLEVCGLKPINNVVDIANYVMLETGQPLHAFDVKKLEGGKIIVRFAKNWEKILTLDGRKYDLNQKILVIADAKKPVAIAGIKGGKFPEIDNLTKIVILESANFNPQTIRQGSKILNLKTDASLRFEHGLDPNLTEFAINRAADLIQKIAGAKIARGLIDVYPNKFLPKKILLDLNYLKNLLGIEISKKEITKILNKLEFGVKEMKQGVLEIWVPTRRLDVGLPEDLIEEIGRIYGYEKIPSVLPIGLLIPPKRNENIFWQDFAKNILKETGFSEIYNYSFISEKEAEIFGDIAKNLIEIENPLSSNQKYLRPSLICNLLKNVKENLKYFDEVKIFELGKVFNKKIKIEEKQMLTGILARSKEKAGEKLFYEAKGIIDSLLQSLGISSVWYDDYKPTPEDSKIGIWNKQKCAEIKIGGGEEIGFLGEINQQVSGNLEIKVPAVAFDIDFEKLEKFASEEHEYRPISQHPAAIRDIAVLVPRGTLVEEVLNKIEVAGGALIRDTDLFDIYEGEELPDGKKNLAFHIIFQAEDRTLTPEEINNLLEKIIKTLEEDPEWEVRK